MADWVETPSGRFVNLDNVVVVDEAEDGSLSMYGVYSGGRTFRDLDADHVREQLSIRSSFRLRAVQDQVAKTRFRGEID